MLIIIYIKQLKNENFLNAYDQITYLKKDQNYVSFRSH
ncbi:MAG: DUF2129 domain-containing protein [Candidatus Lokiarchaeota archaeon]|nr:DUF2129 domain-containing protein [Candidatus Lokiarchaeota archaeon]